MTDTRCALPATAWIKALQVGEVIVRRHVVLVVEQLVGHTVVAGIDHDEDIVAAHRLLHQTLGIATLEAGGSRKE